MQITNIRNETGYDYRCCKYQKNTSKRILQTILHTEFDNLD